MTLYLAQWGRLWALVDDVGRGHQTARKPATLRRWADQHGYTIGD